MRCAICNRIQSDNEVDLYDDICKVCHDIIKDPEDDKQDQGLEPIIEDQGWSQPNE